MPAALAPLLRGEDLEGLAGLTFMLVTADPEGWPHIALLSVGELVGAGPGRIRAALWTSSQTTANLGATGRGTLAVVHDGAAHYLRCRALRGSDLEVAESVLASFELAIVAHREDRADYATLTAGITFELQDPAAVLPRWRETIRLLRLASF